MPVGSEVNMLVGGYLISFIDKW